MILFAVLKIPNFDHFMNFFRIRSVIKKIFDFLIILKIKDFSVLINNNKLSLFHDNPLIVILRI